MGPSSDHVSGDIITTSQQQHCNESEVPLKCPRCESANTKFCYYNNYSKSQPRHYCRACRRHWTEGGVLRDVPVGGLRKSKRRRSSKSPPPTADGATNDAGASADHESSVQTPLHPTQFPPLDCGVAWFSYPPPSATANVENSAYDVDVANPFASISSTSSSANLIGGVDEESFAAFDEQTKAWPPLPLPTPAEYWGEITDLVTLELNSSSIPDRLMEGSWIE